MVVARLPSWTELVHWTDAQLANLDIAICHLACAEGLPGLERFDPQQCLEKLDAWAEIIRRRTREVEPFFHQNPANYENSFSVFRIVVMTRCLHDLGVCYNPAKKPIEAPHDPEDSFIQGAILGAGGTCASLPVVHVAVGRRLGYPLKLVATKGKDAGHLFVRWDEAGGERFNVEVTGPEAGSPPDDYYRTGRYPLTPEIEAAGEFLQSRTPRQELAGFLAQRGGCWRSLENGRRTAEAFAWASLLAPHNRFYHNTLRTDLARWTQRLRASIPAFPELVVGATCRRYPTDLEAAVEQAILSAEAVENALAIPELDRRFWQPLRQGQSVQLPRQIRANFDGQGCQISVKVA